MNRNVHKAHICILLSILVMLTSCGKTTPHEVSHSVQYTDIVTSSGNDSSVGNDSSESQKISSNDEFVPDFRLSFKKDMLVVDYGKTTVNLYHAKYPLYDGTPFEEGWIVSGMDDVCKWCKGQPLISNLQGDGHQVVEYIVLEKDLVLNNIASVRKVPVSGTVDYQEATSVLASDSDAEVLCWTYNLGEFPWKNYENEEWFQVFSEMKQVDYVLVNRQHVDGVPIQNRPCGVLGAVYEWDGVIEPSRQAANQGCIMVNPSRTCIYDIGYSQYSISEAFEKDLVVKNPSECLGGIGKALSYAPNYVSRTSADKTKQDLLSIYGTDVEVYCMELSYAVMDPNPVDYENRQSHELTLVPVWKVYYTVTNSDRANPDIVFCGEVFINAVTGESLYSETYGPEENEFLYPGAKEI